jgi:glycerol-3-phosphate acyltransferase PlsY
LPHASTAIVQCVLSVLLGYLIGCILPAYFIGRFKGVDIRNIGTKNPGTLNTYHSFGLLPSIPTALFDCLKGIVAIITARVIGANFVCAQIAGLAAIAGHVFPFYLRFRGGQGIAAAIGIIIYYLVAYIRHDVNFLYTIGFLSLVFLLFYYVTKQGVIARMISFPVMCFAAFAQNTASPYNYWLLIVVAHTETVAFFNAARLNLIRIKDETFKSHWWRIVLRPCAVIFVVLYLYWSQRMVLIFVGSIALLFILVDVIRFILHQANILFTVRIKNFLKKTESYRFSSMTMFLVAAFIIILVFKQDIAMAALTFLIFGDIFSKICGLGFGKHRLFDKTVEGSVAYLGGALICAYILRTTIHMPILMLAVGAIAATVTEFVPLGIDDNFTVGIVSGAVMTVVRTFGT